MIVANSEPSGHPPADEVNRVEARNAAGLDGRYDLPADDLFVAV
jgi:hypothetical protein